ncbi:MAG: hypothetical protein H6581_18950 [Bacteroidia bacterium]|nr:hypothetical protein [Bacteroidia bacterium]
MIKNLENEELGKGMILQFVGHGIAGGDGFGNEDFIVEWEEVSAQLSNLNEKTDNGLIVNGTIMCFGNGIQKIWNIQNPPFRAALVSIGDRSLQAVYHNIQLYSDCMKYKKVPTKRHIDKINNLLLIAQGAAAYFLIE